MTRDCFAGPIPTTFNSFLFHDYVGNSSDSEGIVVAGGNVTLNQYAIDSHRVAGDPNPGLVVGGAVSLSSSQVWGDLYSAHSVSMSSANVTGKTYANSLDLSYLRDWQKYYTDLSTIYGSAATTGSVTKMPWGALNFVSSSANQAQYFNLTTSMLQGTNSLGFSGFTPGQHIVLNVYGSQAFMSNLDLSGSLGQYDVLFNFVDATSVTFQNTSPNADILAPKAAVKGMNGHIQGTLVADSWASLLEMHIGAGDYLKPPQLILAEMTPVAEPGTLSLFLIGALAVWGASRRKKKGQ